MTAREGRTVRRKGYSLIELVVVLFILAIVAGLTVSIVGWLRRAADKGTASNVMGSLHSNIELFRTTQGSYPNQWDSLHASGGASMYAKLPTAFTQTDPKFTSEDLGATYLSSLTKHGINTVLDHTETGALEGAPGNTGLESRTLAGDGKIISISTNVNGNKLRDSIYPPVAAGATGSGVPSNVKLVVFGFGPRNTAIGKTIVSPPSYTGVGDPSQIYDRYLVVFAVYNDGKRAQLKAVMDTTGDFLNQELAEFWDAKAE